MLFRGRRVILEAIMQIGPWRIWPYTVRLVAGVVAALLWLWFMAPRRPGDRRRLTSLIWILAAGALLGARLGYVAEHAQYFIARPGDILALRDVGGLHGTGAWLGGLIALGLWIRSTGETATPPVQLLIPATLLVAAGAWWGCADAGCAWGKNALTAPSAWHGLVADAPDLYHTVRPRYAVQWIAAVLALGMGVLSMLLPRFGYLFSAGYMLGVAGLSVLRADPAIMVGEYRLDGWLHVALASILLWFQIRGLKLATSDTRE